jgi:hypothetical protein
MCECNVTLQFINIHLPLTYHSRCLYELYDAIILFQKSTSQKNVKIVLKSDTTQYA